MNLGERVDQEFERAWWGDCCASYGEETKQLTYARLMGLKWIQEDGRWPTYTMLGTSVLDVGGGPASILLKCVGLGAAVVVDPCRYPAWVVERYAAHGVDLWPMNAEGLDLPSYRESYDEVWIYNVLQHVRDPEKICANALYCARKCVRIFDWLETPPHLGHPHTLHAVDLDRWLGARGRVSTLSGENGCSGLAYSATLWKSTREVR